MTKVVVALLTCLVLAGCDDQQVQDKVTEVMQHGAVQSYMDCIGNIGAPPSCYSGATQHTYTRIKRSAFQDGSVLQEIRIGPSADEPNVTYSPRGVSTVVGYYGPEYCNGCYELSFQFDEDHTYEITFPQGQYCPSGGVTYVTLIDSGMPDDNQMLCTGFNMNL